MGLALAGDLQAADRIVNQIHRFTMHPPKNGNENGGYPIHENFGLPQESEFSQANPHCMFFHDQRTGVTTIPTACVGGYCSEGMTAPGYIIQHPAASQYLASFQDDICQIICTLKLPVPGDPII